MTAQLYRPKVYTASKLDKAKLWLTLAQDPQWGFVEWTATWPAKVDEELEKILGVDDFALHWKQDISEIRQSDFVLLYGRDSGLRGALVECGAALGFGLKVITIGLPLEHTWSYHPSVTRVQTLVDARNYLYQFTTMIPPASRRRQSDDESAT